MVTRPMVAPVVFLVVATVVVGVVRSQLRHHHTTAPTHHVTTTTAHAKPQPKRGAFYVVHAGDTLSAIALEKHVSLAALQKLNPQVQPTALFLGEKIRLR